MTNRPAAFASSISSIEFGGDRWAWVGSSEAERTSPEVATLITSAPQRINSLTLRRTSSGPSTMVSGLPGHAGNSGAVTPDASHGSPCPPVWLSIPIDTCIRRARNQTLIHRFAQPGIGAAHVARRGDPGVERGLQIARRLEEAIREGRLQHPHISMPLIMKWTCVSKRPGMIVRPEQSTCSSPSRPEPMSTTRPSSMTTSPGPGGCPVPSNTDPPLKTMRVTAPTIRGAGIRPWRRWSHRPQPAGRGRRPGHTPTT